MRLSYSLGLLYYLLLAIQLQVSVSPSSSDFTADSQLSQAADVSYI